MKQIIVAILILLVSGQVLSQSLNDKPQLSFILQGGLLFPGIDAWYFYNDLVSTPTTPEIATGIGMQYGPLVSMEGVDLSSSLEIAFGQLGTVDHSVGAKSAEMVIQRLPVILWFALEAETRLSPFVRVGAGICKTDIREIYTNTYYPSIRFHSWNFTWGYGTGLRYRCSSTLAVAIFIDNWITGGTIAQQNRWGRGVGFYAPYSDSPAGLSITVYL